MERAGRGDKDGKESVWACCATENLFSLLISTQSTAFCYTDFYTTLYSVNQRNYKTLAMQAHALTRTRYFYNLNVIISHPIVYKEGLGYRSACAISSRSSPPSRVRICNGHPGSELCCVHCIRLNQRSNWIHQRFLVFSVSQQNIMKLTYNYSSE
jgi:hypothetical protein